MRGRGDASRNRRSMWRASCFILTLTLILTTLLSAEPQPISAQTTQQTVLPNVTHQAAPPRVGQTPPSVTTTPATNVTATTATLNGNLTSLGAATSVNVMFEYGTSTNYGSLSASIPKTTTGTFNVVVSSLASGVLYHFRAKADGGAEGINYGSDVTFTTTPIAPTVATNNATAITTSSATLNGNLSALGSAPNVSVFFEWGTTTAYGNSTPGVTKATTGAFSASLTGLSPGTSYHFRAKADGSTHGIAVGSNLSFATFTGAPTVATLVATGVTQTGAMLNGNLISLGLATTVNVYFEYGVTTSYGNNTTPQAKTAPGVFSAATTSLTPGTAYHYRAKADGGAAGIGNGGDSIFITLRTIANGRILFYSTQRVVNGVAHPGTYVMNADGSNQALLSADSPPDHPRLDSPEFSPDGTKIAASHTTGSTTSHIYLMNADATGEIDLTPDVVYTSYASAPRWSPDGTKVAFITSWRINAGSAGWKVHWRPVTGGGGAIVTGDMVRSAPVSFSPPMWSPDGARIYYPKQDVGWFSVKTDGTDEQPFQTLGSDVSDAAWSSDGTRIVFITARDGNNEVYVINADGTGLARLTNNTGSDDSARWSPDGTRIVFSSTRDGNTDIYVMNADGTGQTRLTNDPGEDWRPSWGGSLMSPGVLTLPVSGITTTGASLNGSLQSLGAAANVNVSFDYGATTAYGSSTTPQARAAIGAFSQNITGLMAATLYHCRARADGGASGLGFGIDVSFTTGATAPAVLTNPATYVTATSARLNGTLTSVGTATTVNVSFKWGLTTAYGSATVSQAMTSPGSLEASITGLSALTSYNYRAEADGGVHGLSYGANMTFTTIAGTSPPVVTTSAATNVTNIGATLNGNLTSLGTATTVNVNFEYGTTTSYGTQTTTQAKAATGAFNADVAGLTPSTTYNFRAKADGGAVGVATGANATFTTGAAEAPPGFLIKWGTQGTGDGQFNSPQGIALDSSGNVYVTDISNHRIQKFTSSGTFITKWGTQGTGDGQFNNPSTLAVDSSGNVYVADLGNNRVQKFTSSGTFITKWGTQGTGDGQFNGLNGIALDSSGNVYTAEYNNHRIQVFTSSGTFITKWGSPGSGDSQFASSSSPVDVAVDASGNVFAADTYNGRIQKFTSSGVFAGKWGGPGQGGSGYGQFSLAVLVAVDASGNVYVADRGNNNRIHKFTGAGVFLTMWGITGAGDGQFNTPGDIAVSPSGRVFVADTGNHRIQVFGTASPPSVTTGAASAITPTSATLSGNLTSMGSVDSVGVNFEYGTTTAYGSTTPIQNLTAVGTFSSNVSALSAGQTYNYRAKANGGAHGSANGANSSFTTTVIAPSVTTAAATGVTLTAATLNGNLTALGTASTVNASFEYGTTTGYGNTTTPQAMTSTAAFSANLTGLSQGTSYHFRAKGDGGIHGIGYGSDMTFSTGLPPAVQTLAATAITTSGATLNGNLTSLGAATTVNVFFEIGTSTSYGSATLSQAMTATGAFSSAIIGLNAGTLYHFRAKADGGAAGTANGDDMTFTTLTATPVVTTTAATIVRANSATLNGNLTSLGTATSVSVSFEYGLTTAYGTATPTQAKTAPETFSAAVTDLTAGNIYHFRAKADGGAVGTGTGNDLTFSTTTVEVNNGRTINIQSNGIWESIPIAIKNIPNLGAENGVGAFTFNLAWNKDVINVTALTGATISGFSITPGTPNNTAGTATLAGFTTGTAYLNGTVTVAYLNIRAVGLLDATTEIGVAIANMGDKNSVAIPACPVSASVRIATTDLVSETSIALLKGEGDVAVIQVNIDRVKNKATGQTATIPGGVGAYTAQAVGVTTGGIELLNVLGVSPFDNPTFNTSTGIFSVYNVTSPPQPNNTPVARLVPKLTGDCNTSYTYTISFQTIAAATGPELNVPEEHANSLTFKRGDVSNNGTVDIFDAMFIAQHIVGTRPIGEINYLNAACVKHDGTGGDKLDIFDAMFIAQYVVGLRNSRFE